jgi:amidase
LLCEKIYKRISEFIGKGDLFLFPTTPNAAPLKGSLNNLDTVIEIYDRTMAISSFAGIGRIPEISIPVTMIDGIPIALSLSTGVCQDEFFTFSS